MVTGFHGNRYARIKLLQYYILLIGTVSAVTFLIYELNLVVGMYAIMIVISCCQGDRVVELLIQLKLMETMKNSFEYCEVHMPFFNRYASVGVIMSVCVCVIISVCVITSVWA